MRRLGEHRRGLTHTTKRIGERQLIRAISCASREEARTLEKKMKNSGHYHRQEK